MDNPIIIAVDGPSASGKGTVAKGLAEYFNFAHLDTGLLYRGVGYLAVRKSVSDNLSLEAAAIHVSQNFPAEILSNADLRTDEASSLASKVATIPQVRDALLDFQRDFAISPPADGSVLDGRDIGTVICPLAPVKLYITATVEVRAERRHKELEQILNREIDIDNVLEDLKARDARDMNRMMAPLKAADDAVILDTSKMSIDAAIAKAITLTQSVMQQKDKTFVCI